MTQVIKTTSKGQVTIPNTIRNKLGIDKDTYIAVDTIGDYIIMKKVELKLKEISKIMEKRAKDNKISKKEIENIIIEAREEVWSDE